jgi:hypothetical protein
VLLSQLVVGEWKVAACIVAFVLHSNGRWLEACLGLSRQREEKRVAVLLAFSAKLSAGASAVAADHEGRVAQLAEQLTLNQ